MSLLIIMPDNTFDSLIEPPHIFSILMNFLKSSDLEKFNILKVLREISQINLENLPDNFVEIVETINFLYSEKFLLFNRIAKSVSKKTIVSAII